MDNVSWIIGLLIAVLGSGFVYTRFKNRQIDRLEKQNKELARSEANTIAEKRKSDQKAEAAEAGKTLQEKAYEAVIASKARSDASSDTPLSEEDRKIAKDIMSNHRSN